MAEATIFNPAQMKLLQMMSYIKTDEELEELQNVLSDYFAKKVDQEMDKLWDEGIINEKTTRAMGQGTHAHSVQMSRIVLDTNCLLISLPKASPFRCVWDAFRCDLLTN